MLKIMRTLGLTLTASLLMHQGHAQSAYAMADQTTGYILDSQKGMEKRPIGSLTKIAAAKVVLDWAQKNNTDLSQQLVIPPEALDTASTSSVGLQPNDMISYRDLLYATLMTSDNAAINTLAYYVGEALRQQGLQQLKPSDAFVSQMNALARNLGMEKTLFVNATGVEPRRGLQPYSTALDLIKLAAYAIKDPGFRFYVSQKQRKVTVTREGRPQQYMLQNTNELLGVAGVDGVKSGQTAKSGQCVILSAARDPEVKQGEGTTTYVTPRRIDVVILGSSSGFGTANELLNRAWSLYDQWAAMGRPTQSNR
jgi:serine-type D-Ala-D-Ala carboxypeptidase (penicillin-binding protein 5/6)